MSRHEGVSCDSCLKSNFRGRRYKCLICYDYDLCANCYEEGAVSTRHSADHPMQCILTRTDFELYYGGEILSQDQPQSFTCPYCKKMGLSDSALLDHVSAEHTDTGLEVVCPVCAALPGGEPNLVTDDFAGHLALEHRTGPRDLISFLDEPSAIRHGGVRRIPHSGRALGGPRSRRSNMHFSSSGGLSALSPSGRESVDPIAELLSQLSGVRRGAPQPSQLQQLQMQLQFERQQVSATRQQLERFPRRFVSSGSTGNNSGSGGGAMGNASSGGSASASNQWHNQQQQSGLFVGGSVGSGANGNSAANSRDAPISSSTPMNLGGGAGSSTSSSLNQQNQSQFLLARFMSPSLDENELTQLERDVADRSQFVQALMLSTMSNLDHLKLVDEDTEDKNKSSGTNKSDDMSKIDLEEDFDDEEEDEEEEEEEDENCYEHKNSEIQSISHQLGISRGNGGGGGCGGGGGGGCIQKPIKPKPPAHSSKPLLPSTGGLVSSQDRRNRPPPPPTQSKPARELKATTMSATKHLPDTR